MRGEPSAHRAFPILAFTRSHSTKLVEILSPRMIQRVLKYVGIDPSSDNVKMHDTPAASDKILNRDTDGPLRNQTWNYRGVLGCLSYLQSMVRPDITFAVQQCARFANDP